MAKEKRNFKIKMHLACSNDELRPVMSLVCFQDGFMVSTDAHLMIKAKLSEMTHFSEDEIKILEGKFLTKQTFKQIIACDYVTVSEAGIQDNDTKTLHPFFSITDNGYGKYPNFNAVIPNDTNPLDTIGINPSLAKKLFGILAPIGGNIKMIFSKPNRAIRIKLANSDYSDDAVMAILMPVVMDDAA